MAERGLPEPKLFPMIRARMTAINGRPIEEVEPATDRGEGFAEREQNLSWAEQPQLDNRIVAGRWWDAADRGKHYVSVATEYQEELGLELGDRLAFDVAGETVEAQVLSFREVEWDTFRPNFFLVFSPGTLDGLAGTWLTSMKLDLEQRKMLVDLVRRFPSVSVFDIDAILAQVREVIDRASLAVQYVFLFTLAAGITVLLAAIQSTRDERRYESAMLRTLGARRRVVLAGVASEFVALGMLAGVLAAIGATLAGWLLAKEVFDLQLHHRSLGVGHRAGGGRRDRRRRGHARGARRHQSPADRDIARGIATRPCRLRILRARPGVPIASMACRSRPLRASATRITSTSSAAA